MIKVTNITISQIVKDDLCVGCGTCIALCPADAIKLTINEKKGIYVPELNEDKCTNCGTCYKVCPGHEVDFKALNLEIFGKEPEDILMGNYLNCYVGHATDYDIRYNSSSGGLVTQLLIFALEEGMIDGALVTRMKKDKPLEPEPFIARTKEEIIEASKSKYCPVPANVALRDILGAKEGERFAVVGLPCHIHGLRKAELINNKLKERIILHLGILCLHTINFWGIEFSLQRLNIERTNIKKIDYRGEGWPGGMSIALKDGNKMFIPMSKYYDNRFGSFIPMRCTLCCDHACELADISFGDAWLPELMNDKMGTSIIISKSRECNNILQQMAFSNKIELNEITCNKVLMSQGGLLWKKRDIKARFTLLKLFGKKMPIYNQELLRPKFNNYLSTILLYSKMLLIEHHLWKLLDIYCSLLKYGNYIKSKLKL